MKIRPHHGDDGEVVAWLFWCVGCDMPHSFQVKPHRSQTLTWSFNGDEQKPTFSPSLRCDFGDGRKCHLFVRDGEIQYLPDCTHHLAGQTIPLPDEEEDAW